LLEPFAFFFERFKQKRNKIFVFVAFLLFPHFCKKLLVIYKFSIFIFFVVLLLKKKHHIKQKVLKNIFFLRATLANIKAKVANENEKNFLFFFLIFFKNMKK
jgi:hypothetical protein